MKTLGIDLSTEPAETGVCLIEWEADVPRASFPGYDKKRDNELLLGLMGDDQCACTAIDAPFGWPEQFREALNAYACEDRWERWRGTEGFDFDKKRSWLGRRRTDYFIYKKTEEKGAALTPFSVGASLFSATAMRCAELLVDYYKDKGELKRVDGPVVETYPAAARVRWQCAASPASADKPSGRSDRAWRYAWFCLIKRECKLELPPKERSRVAQQKGGHDFDALICALVARAAGRAGTFPPSKGDEQRAKREGWIHMPKCSLSDLQ